MPWNLSGRIGHISPFPKCFPIAANTMRSCVFIVSPPLHYFYPSFQLRARTPDQRRFFLAKRYAWNASPSQTDMHEMIFFFCLALKKIHPSKKGVCICIWLASFFIHLISKRQHPGISHCSAFELWARKCKLSRQANQRPTFAGSQT